MSTVIDAYASRSEAAAAIRPRQDPIVYGKAGAPGLSELQLARYQQDGYLLLESFFSPAEVDVLMAEARRLAADPATRRREETILEPGSEEVRSVFAVHQLDRLFERVARDERLVACARSILGGDVYVHQSRLNLKPGFVGKEFYWHSDFETWHVEDGMPRMRALSCTVLLDENNEFNGPLFIVPGSHKYYVTCVGATPEDHYKQSLKKQEVGVPDPGSLAALVERGGIASMKGPAGSVILFDCNAMHGSGSNISPYPRSNLFLVYNSVENRLEPPHGGLKPRPEFIAARREVEPLAPLHTDYSAWR